MAATVGTNFESNDNGYITQDEADIAMPLIPTMCSGYDKDDYCRHIVKRTDDSDLGPSPEFELFKFDTNVDQFDGTNEYINRVPIVISVPRYGFIDNIQTSLNIRYITKPNRIIVSKIEYSAYEEGRDIVLVAHIEAAVIDRTLTGNSKYMYGYVNNIAFYDDNM